MKNPNFAVLAAVALLSAIYSLAQTATRRPAIRGYPILASIAQTRPRRNISTCMISVG